MTGDGQSTPVVLLDACVLVPIRLTTTLLALAEAGLFEVLWSEQILDEVERNLPKVGLSPAAAARRVAAMKDGFGDAALVDDFADLIDTTTCDAKDRHVLAAAVKGGADTLVTFNLTDFPTESTTVNGITAVHPDTFLTDLLLTHTGRVLSAIHDAVADLQRPSMTTRAFLASLTFAVPIFANSAADALATGTHTSADTLPGLVLADERDALAHFGQTGDLTDPAQVALSFWLALGQNLDLARSLTFDPQGDYKWAIEMLERRSLASKVIDAVDAPGDVAFMQFIPEVSAPAEVSGGFVTNAVILTLVRQPDNTWRVRGLGPGFPSSRDIFGVDAEHATRFHDGPD